MGPDFQEKSINNFYLNLLFVPLEGSRVTMEEKFNTWSQNQLQAFFKQPCFCVFYGRITVL